MDDVRLAFTILTTAWHRHGARLRAGDLADFHRAFGQDRIRGTLSREQLLAGADRLFGDDFSAGYADLGRRGWGIVFRDQRGAGRVRPGAAAGGRRAAGAHAPAQAARRPGLAHLRAGAGALGRRWCSTLLAQTRRWPEFASELGRFTAVRDTAACWARPSRSRWWRA